MEYVQGKELKEFIESQSNKMKKNIKMRVMPEQSMKVQDIVIMNMNTQNKVDTTDIHFPYIIISNTGTSGTRDIEFYKIQNYQEIDADLFIRTNGTCEESVGSKFQPSDEVIRATAKVNGWDKLETSHYTMNMLLDKLKKKNEILKKARIKRKNQREELHKLNLKLQKCISLEEHDLKMKTVLNEKHKLELENIEMGKLVNLYKSALDLAVITKDLEIKTVLEQQKEIEKLKAVIEYLESKVK